MILSHRHYWVVLCSSHDLTSKLVAVSVVIGVVAAAVMSQSLVVGRSSRCSCRGGVMVATNEHGSQLLGPKFVAWGRGMKGDGK